MGMVWYEKTKLSPRVRALFPDKAPYWLNRWFLRGGYVFLCNGCGAMDPPRWSSSTAKDENGRCLESCSECNYSGSAFYPDVYFDGKPVENLCDPTTGKPMVFISRGHKARYMRDQGVTEVGDRVHGAPYTLADANRKPSRDDVRRQVHEAVQKARQMPREQKRAVLRQIAERTRHG